MREFEEPSDAVENAPVFTQKPILDLMREVLPDMAPEVLYTDEAKGVALPERSGDGPRSPKLYRPSDAIALHHSCLWVVAAGEPTVGRILGHNAGAYVRRLGLANILGAMHQGFSVLRPMMVAGRDIAGGSPILIRPEDIPTDPVLLGTLHPWPDLRDSLSAVLKKLAEVVNRPPRRATNKLYPPTAMAARALASVRAKLAKTAEVKAGE